MKVQIINQNHQYFGYIIEPVKMNFENVLIEIDGQKQLVDREDTKIIAENEYEETIKRCEDLLKIKLDRGISIVLYTALCECIEKELSARLKSIDVIRDDYKLLSKGRWKKDIIILANAHKPLEINISGEKFNNKYTIKITQIEDEQFLLNSEQEIEILDKQIQILKEKKEIYERYSHRNNFNNCVELSGYCIENVVS